MTSTTTERPVRDSVGDVSPVQKGRFVGGSVGYVSPVQEGRFVGGSVGYVSPVQEGRFVGGSVGYVSAVEEGTIRGRQRWVYCEVSQSQRRSSRRYWATDCLEAGVPVHTVSARLGHIDLRTTARCAAPRPEQIDEIAAVLDRRHQAARRAGEAM